MEDFNLAVASLNQTPMAWERNFQNIKSSILDSYDSAHVLLTPEMSVCGYDMEDVFLSHDAFIRSAKTIGKVIALLDELESELVVVAGAPLMMASGQVFNASYVLNRSGIVGISLKPNLAGEGLHYEGRWFKSWPVGKQVSLTYKELFSELTGNHGVFEDKASNEIVVGDVSFELNGVLVSVESCEAAFAVNRPAINHYQRGVDIILNPSASHMAVEPGYDKYETRQEICTSASRALGVVYAYANLQGCSGGRSIYDGGNIIASAGKVVATGPRLSFKDVDVVKATLSVRENRNLRSMHSETIGGVVGFKPVSIKSKPLDYIEPKLNKDLERLNDLGPISKTYNLMAKGVALGLWDWALKTKVGHYTLSLSGGADSSLCASLVYLSHICALTDMGSSEYKEKLTPHLDSIKAGELSLDDIKECVMPQFFTTAYQKTENSSLSTECAAKELAESIGAEFHSIDIQSIVDIYQSEFNKNSETDLSWENAGDDLPLQNLQARVRNPMIWLFANRKNSLLITTSNKSENAVGYFTQDGDSAGVISPIGGINKSNIVGNSWNDGEVGLLKFLCNEGVLLSDGKTWSVPGLKPVISLKPSAELRAAEKCQNDEDDLMPFPLLDEIERLHQVMRLSPKAILLELLKKKTHDYSSLYLAEKIAKYVTLFVRSEWKRNKNAVAFHIERNSLDPKTYARFPLLNDGLNDELEDMWSVANKLG